MSKDNKSFYTKIIGNSNLEIKISSVESDSDMETLREWSKENHEMSKKMYEDHGNKRHKTLVDITDIKKIHSGMVKVITDLIKANDEYTEKVATFGGSSFVVMAQDAVVSLSGTKQEFKAFTNREEAEIWLNS